MTLSLYNVSPENQEDEEWVWIVHSTNKRQFKQRIINKEVVFLKPKKIIFGFYIYVG